MLLAITGSSGFVGSNLIEYLSRQNIETIRLSRLGNQGYAHSLLDSLKLNSIDGIVHLAGKAHDLKKTTNELEYFVVNTELTKDLYNEFIKSSIPVFIFISSVKACADSIDYPLHENHIPKPLTAYGQSKLKAEQYIIANPPSENKRFYILRPCMIHGPRNKGNLNLLYNLSSKKIPWPLGAYENKRSYCSIENLCFVIKELIEREDIPSGIYNIADNEPVSTNELINIIAASFNRKPNVLYLPQKIIKAIAKMGDHLRLPLNSERLQKLTESYIVSNAKLLKALGKPLPVSAKDGLKITIESFKKNAK
jgi:nucleoside-diphosphate-sugar epimerase